jgi:outer membrane protein OmpA-like peptidoglycan-associated protein
MEEMVMRHSKSVVAALFIAAGVLPACATKGYVQRNVKTVDDKVETLSGSLEETQARTKKNEEAITDVDKRAQAAASAASTAANTANTAATRAQQSAGEASNEAKAADSKAVAADAKVAEVDKNAKRLVFTVVLSDDEGNFKSADSKLPDDAKAKIDQLVAQLKADPKGAFFEIEGHTDSVGPKEFNEKLGMERAEAVKKYLYEQHQIPLHKMNVISYGPERPAAPNKTKEGRAQNRRVVIKVLV